jgi:ferredoxin
MKTIIYYFTGTGNSLAAAKKIAAGLEDCELVPIASLRNTTGDVTPQAGRIGIVYPVYDLGLPVIVASFAERLDLSHSQYTFSVATQNQVGGSSAIQQLDGVLKKRQNRGLDAGYVVNMPRNNILMHSPPVGMKRDQILTKADKKLADITGMVGRCEHRKLPYHFIVQLMHALLYNRFLSHVHNDDRKFSVNDKCTSCGTCAAICPVGNIELVNGKPIWRHHCELCVGCIHICPVKAIQGGPRTATRPRYRNPAVSIKELEAQQGENYIDLPRL